MKTQIIKIGNSKGIRIPKSFLNQIDIENEVDLVIENNHIVIKPINNVRQNWSEAFKSMAEDNPEQLFDSGTSLSSFDDDEWVW